MPTNKSISVFLVAGNRLLREALARLLNKKGDFDICGVSPFGPDVSASVVELDADVLVVDEISARMSDFAFISEIAALSPRTRIVLIDMDDSPDTFLKCVRAGAVGYLLKDASSASVISCVRAVVQGEAVCPPGLCMPLFQSVARRRACFPSAEVRDRFGLTRRQQQLVPLIAQGFTNKEIASHLNISEQTVKNHIHRMLRRVGAADRLQVIDMTRELGAFP